MQNPAMNDKWLFTKTNINCGIVHYLVIVLISAGCMIKVQSVTILFIGDIWAWCDPVLRDSKVLTYKG